MYYWLGAIAIAVIIGLIFLNRRKKRLADDEHQMLSFVALLKESRHLEPIMIQTAARKAWGAELGIGDDEGPDGFVVGNEALPSIVMNYQGHMILVNNFPVPYVDDPEEAAESIGDLRLRSLVAEHTAWISCDALGVESFDDMDAVREWYKRLGPLLCELVDDNCLAIMLPQTGQIFANMEETLDMLKSDDPLEKLMDEAPVPIVQIGEDDPRMQAAVQEARDNWPKFVRAFENRAGENFGVKAPISRNGNTEFIWLEVTAIENGVVYGKLANEPMDLGSLKLGDNVKTKECEINDWAYFDGEQPYGMYTVKVLTDAQNDPE